MADLLQVPWPLSSAPGASVQLSAGRLINCAAEPIDNPDGPKVAWLRRPGITSFADPALSPYRGGILVGSLAFVAAGTSVVTVDAAGTVTALAGVLPGSDRVTFARDNETTQKIQCVSPANGAFDVSIAGGVVSFNGGGALPAPNSVAGQDSYFFWTIGDNRVFAAGPNTTTVNALTFVTIQSRATGNLIRAVPYQGLMWFFATNFCEVWQDTAQTSPAFPYSRYAVIDIGLFGRNAIAGWEDGFGKLIFAANDFGVYRFNGSTPEKISPPDLDRLIAAASANPDSVFAQCYAHEGKKFWAISGPTWTWEFNLNTERWNERASLKGGLFEQQPWRAAGSLLAFNKWLVGDLLSTKIGFVDPKTQQEYGQALRSRMESGLVNKFPNRQPIARADFNFVTGVGLAAGTTATAQNPMVSIQCSRDGGQSWDNARLRALGLEGRAKQRVYATRFGLSTNRGPRFRIDISDEVFAGFAGATCSNNGAAF